MSIARMMQMATGKATFTSKIYDFKLGAAPSGIIEFSGVAPEHTWNSYLSMTAVNLDPNSNPSYPIRIDNTFSGDWLFQASTRIDLNPGGTPGVNSSHCSDAGIGLFNTPPTENWRWFWNTLAGRIAVQNNCSAPYIYGQSNQSRSDSTPLALDGVWVTMHMFHRPSINQTQYQITQGFEDWDLQSTVIENLLLSDSFTGDYYCGISSDDDDDDMVFSAFRVEKL